VLQLTEAHVESVTNAGTQRETTTLPYHWDRRHGGLPGTARFELRFALSELPPAPMAIYISRIGNVYALELNGVLLQQKGNPEHDDGEDYAKAPRFIDIPGHLLAYDNVLRVRIRADGGRRGGLGPVVVGPADQMDDLYREDFVAQNGVGLAIVVLSLLVSIAALALWLTQKDPRSPGGGRDRVYLFACLAELGWALRVANLLIEQPPLPWRPWSVLMVVVFAAWAAGMMAFSCEVAGWTRRRAGRATVALAWLLPVVGALAAELGWRLGSIGPVTLFYVASAVVLTIFSAFLWRAALRRGASAELRVLALAIAVNVLVGLRDLVIYRFEGTYGPTTIWLRYSSALFGVALGGIVVMRFRAANAAVRGLLGNLSQQVRAKEDELRRSYSQLEQLARQQERAAERSRILRDMHDGVGAHLSAAIRQLQSGRGERGEVLATLRDALEQLKLSIDAMNLPPGDINALLAGLRYRLEPRFAASDLRLEWEVDALEPIPRLDPAAMHQLQFMVFEALSNVLQHAQARVLRIEARREGDAARIRIVDDGCGFDLQARPRKGLQAMRDRAAAIGAALRLESAPGRTAVEITLVP
jgi:signal transduction histidine kinase